MGSGSDPGSGGRLGLQKKDGTVNDKVAISTPPPKETPWVFLGVLDVLVKFAWGIL